MSQILSGINLNPTRGSLLTNSTTNQLTNLSVGSSGQVIMPVTVSSHLVPNYQSLTGMVANITSTGSFFLNTINGVSNKTGNYTLTSSDYLTLFTNAGASGSVQFTLPSSITIGLHYYFVCISPRTMILAVGNTVTQTFTMNRGGATQSRPYLIYTGTATNIASYVEIVAISTTTWQILNMFGTWTFSLIP